MPSLSRPVQTPRHTSQPATQRATTLDMVRHACPDRLQALRICESFGLAVVDSDSLRDLHFRQLIDSAMALKEGLAPKAMQIHMQRVVGSFIGSAYGAGQFYSRAVTAARDVTATWANEGRDEDLNGPVGFDSRAQRKRDFAAQIGLQAHMLRMAAEGAVCAYEEITGESWKPYNRSIAATSPVSLDQKAASLQMSAFD